MRTTINLDPGVLEQLRQRSHKTGKTMGAVASELLAQALAVTDDADSPAVFHWATADLGEPYVDLEDPEAVRARLDTDR